jgi:Holliday junction resolvase RusA-like endonuclease
MIEIELPYPPSVNHYYRRLGPRTLISREGRRFRERVLSVLAATRPRPLDGPIAVQVEVFPPDHRRRDIDNVQKSLFDALQHGGVYRDDSQIVRLQIEKRGCVPGGLTIVRIQECS